MTKSEIEPISLSRFKPVTKFYMFERSLKNNLCSIFLIYAKKKKIQNFEIEPFSSKVAL